MCFYSVKMAFIVKVSLVVLLVWLILLRFFQSETSTSPSCYRSAAWQSSEVNLEQRTRLVSLARKSRGGRGRWKFHDRRSTGAVVAVLLLCAGDVELNPGPTRYPCTVCGKNVTEKQQGIECTKCEKWSHAQCCGVSRVEYTRIGEREDEPWFCPGCLASELPFVDASLDSCSSHFSMLDEDDGLYAMDANGTRNSLTFCYLNIRSLLPKLDECRNVIQQASRRFIFGMSETWLTESVTDGEAGVGDYTLYRRDRENRSHGGVLLYVPEEIRSFRRQDLEVDGVEAIWVELRTKCSAILTGVVYRPPKAAASITKDICDMFEAVTQEGKEVVIMGDFNLNMLSPNSSALLLQTSAIECGLKQMITEPTRVTNNSNSLIDLLFVSHPDTFTKAGCLDVLDSDHLMNYGVYCTERSQQTPRVKSVRTFKQCNTGKLIEDMEEAPWSVMDTLESIDDMWDYWKSLFLSVLDQHAPRRKVRMRVFSGPWMSEDVLKIARARNYYRTKYRRTGNSEDWESFRKLRNLSKSTIRKAKANYFEGVCAEGSRNSRKTWNELNKAMGRNQRQGVSMLKTDKGELLDSKSIAEEFSSFFEISGMCENGAITGATLLPKELTSCFRLESVDDQLTLELLESLNVGKATGVDGISARVLKTTAPGIAKSLTQLFNYSLRTGEIPEEWKAANVTPVFKKGRKVEVNNYRPVSVLPVAAKLFESIVHRQLYTYLSENHLLNPAQSGFRPQHSTLDALLKAIDDWRQALDKSDLVGAVFVDLSKAFDSINHTLLIKKLEALGIRDGELRWFKNYLSGRKQRVTVNGAVSSWRPVSRGVPQGSILGPLLFCVFVNDLPENVGTSVSLYADDTTLYHSCKDYSELENTLESSLENVAKWVDDNGLRINVKKTQVMFLSTKGRKKELENAKLVGGCLWRWNPI